MSKYEKLWAYVREQGEASFQMTFSEIAEAGGVPVDHSLLNAKKELTAYGYQVGKISLKHQTIRFEKLS